MVIQKLIADLKKHLEGRARRTKAVYESVDGIVNNIDMLFGETQKTVEKLSKMNDSTFEPLYEHKIGKSLKDCFISLKSLKEVDKFTSLLYIFDKVLDQYHMILQELVKKNEDLKFHIENITVLEKKLEKINQEYVEKIKNDSDMEISTKNPINYEVNNQCQPLQKWILIDKYSEIPDEVLEEKWDSIEGTVYISKDYSSEILEETLKNIEPTDFIEFYQSIGKSKEDFNIKRLEKLNKNQLNGFEFEFLKHKMKIPRYEKIISEALHFDSKAERFLKEEMERNKK